MRVTRLVTYPVKSLGGVDDDRVRLSAQGFVDDRRWALVDPDGRRVSARECPVLLGLTATPRRGGITLSDGAGRTLDVMVPRPDAPVVATTVKRRAVLTLADSDASAWISERAGRPLRLVYQADDQPRAVAPDHGGRPGDVMTLADAGPLLLVTEESVAAVMDWVDDDSPDWLDPQRAAQRFRPNVVVAGGEPFAEDRWRRLRLGATWFRRSELCDRCVMTTVDLTTLRPTKEPIRALAKHRRWDNATWFGVRYIPELAPGDIAELSLGDAVTAVAD